MCNHRGLTALAIAVLTYGPLQPLGAQQQQTVFVHGLGQSGQNWNALAADLAARHPLNPWKPSLPQQSYYGTQATSLRSYLNALGFSGVPVISHSNGGVVVREYARTTAPSRVNRHLTLGTPHRGAALAHNLYYGDFWVWAAWMGSEILDPLIWYSMNDPDLAWLWFNNINHSGIWVEAAGVDIADALAIGIPIGLSAAGYLLASTQFPEVLPQMSPSSSFFGTLNSSPTLAVEAQRIPAARVSISTSYSWIYSPWRSFAGSNWSANEWAWNKGLLTQAAIDAYWY